MHSNETRLVDENVNGVKLSLKIDSKVDPPMSRIFTISFKSEKSISSWSKFSLLFAVMFNILAFMYVKINVTAILVIIITFSFLAFFWITHSVQSETLVVIPTVGIQSTVKYVWGREDEFIPWPNVVDIIINEVLKTSQVLFFLTVIVKGEEESIKLQTLFQYTKPRLLMLEKIYCEMQNLLMDAERVQKSKASGDTE